MTEPCPECGREVLEAKDHGDVVLYVHERDQSGIFPVVTDRCFAEVGQ